MDNIYPNRQSCRLNGFDYGQSGAYFITLCVEGRKPLLGQISDGQVILSEAGQIVQEEWLRTPQVRPGVALDEWTIMPDHFHAILFIDSKIHRQDIVGAHRSAPALAIHRPARTLGSIIGQFKSVTTTRINALHGTDGRIWQRGFNDRIIRNQEELERFRLYIRNNPKET